MSQIFLPQQQMLGKHIIRDSFDDCVLLPSLSFPHCSLKAVSHLFKCMLFTGNDKKKATFTCAFSNSPIFKSPKFSFLSPKFSKFNSLGIYEHNDICVRPHLLQLIIAMLSVEGKSPHHDSQDLDQYQQNDNSSPTS
jgi:hypothetical protein